MSAPRDQKRLGRGLSSLIQATLDTASVATTQTDQAESATIPPSAASSPPAVRIIRCDAIRPNPYQPRADIPETSLDELAESIRRTGVIQPIIVRRQGAAYELIAGERRWRATQKAGISEIPAIVRSANDEQMLEFALIENIFREDLNAIDRANAYRRYCDAFGLTADQVANRLGEDRTTVTNYLRLLDLPASVQDMVRDGRLSMGHARALAGLDDRQTIEKVANIAYTNSFSVRAIEELVRKEKDNRRPIPASAPSSVVAAQKRPHIRDLEQQFVRALDTKVEILESRKRGAGRIVIHYFTLDDFDRVAERLGIRWQE